LPLLEDHVTGVLALETYRSERLQAELFLGLVSRPLLVGQLLHEVNFGPLVAGRRVVVFVQVDLSEEQYILAADEKNAVGDIGKVSAGAVGLGDEYALDG
jgi:hypothetical protein